MHCIECVCIRNGQIVVEYAWFSFIVQIQFDDWEIVIALKFVIIFSVCSTNAICASCSKENTQIQIWVDLFDPVNSHDSDCLSHNVLGWNKCLLQNQISFFFAVFLFGS